ncbi:MAG: response regulator transcription factor [Chloroflexota bacterium]|nr:response regulator transcription factor [Chloroflexota bacterium]
MKNVKARSRILIADDHPLLREAIRSAFEQHDDIEVLAEASDGDEAVSLCSKLKPDVVVMDIVMPRLSGIEATKQIRKVSPGTAVLILTAYDDDRYVIGLLEAGAAGYLLKSARGQDLVEAVRTVRAGESVLHPTIIAKILKHRMHQNQTGAAERKIAEPLSERESEILKLAARGMSNKDIAAELFLSVRTVKAHLSNIFNKLGVASRTEAIVKGVREGWLTLDDLAERQGQD